MIKKFLIMFIIVEALVVKACQWTDSTTGYTWYYRDISGGVEIYNKGNLAVKPFPKGELVIPAKLHDKNVVSIGDGAFSECRDWTGTLIIPDGVKTIGRSAFFNCRGFTKIVIPPSVRYIGGGAFYASGNGSVHISDMTAWCLCKFGDLGANPLHSSKGDLYLNEKIVVDLVIPRGVTTIGASTFSGAKCVKHVFIPNSVTNIGDWSFSWCKGLTDVVIPEGVVRIGHAAFDCCNNIKSVYIPSSVENIGTSAFRYCLKLKECIVSSGNKNYRTKPGCLLSKDGRILVSGIGSLSRLKIPDGVAIIGDEAFCSMDSLKEIYIPNSVQRIGKKSFFQCELQKLQLNEHLKYIDKDAFERCYSLSDVVIPKNVEHIGEGAFKDCRNLSSIVFKGDAPNIVGRTTFRGCRQNCTAYVSKTANGFPLEGERWNGLIISYTSRIDSKSN